MCKKSLILLFLAVFLGGWIPHPAHAERVVELYSSTGCPSCPPADRLMQDLVREPGVIGFSCHVTYFDQPRARDPMSLGVCDQRQKSFRKSGVASKSYTPQMVINGQSVAQGNKEDVVRRAVKNADDLPVIGLQRKGGDLSISLPAMRLHKPAVLIIMAYDDVRRSGGIDYVNVITRVRRLMNWEGAPMKMSLPIGNVDADRFIALAQYADHTDIIAAGRAH